LSPTARVSHANVKQSKRGNHDTKKKSLQFDCSNKLCPNPKRQRKP
jgi:hypothetical protein